MSWSYMHTGGLPLNSVSVSYMIEDDASVSPIPIPVTTIITDDVHVTSVNVSGVSAGDKYTFNITAENDIGSFNLVCGPTTIQIGKKHHHHVAILYFLNSYSLTVVLVYLLQCL